MAYTLDQEQTQLYKDYVLQNDYTFVSGAFALPVATEEDGESPVDVIQAFRPYRVRNLRFSASKNNAPPVLPSPESVGAFAFLGGDISMASPSPTSNNSFQWTANGELTFVCTAASTDGLILGNRPMIFEQQAAVPVFSNGSDLPADVQEAGRGPIAGYRLGEQVNLNDPYYQYPEISYFPAAFFSTDLLTGPASYPNFS